MSESAKTPPPRRTIAVTIAGTLFLLWAVSAFLVAVIAIENAFSESSASAYQPVGLVKVGIMLVQAVGLGYAGLAMMLRWRRCRIWAGTVSWALIVIVVLGLFGPPPPPGTDYFFAILLALLFLGVAVFALIAKRLERRPEIAAVFDD